jgi:hypothetical protein
VTKRSRIIIIALIAVIIVAGVGVAVSMRSIEPRLQEWLKASLSESLDGDVELHKSVGRRSMVKVWTMTSGGMSVRP